MSVTMDCRESFRLCVMEALGNQEYVTNWERLNGKRLFRQKASTGIDALVDAACKVPEIDEAVLREFFADVKRLIWDRLSPETILELEVAARKRQGAA